MHTESRVSGSIVLEVMPSGSVGGYERAIRQKRNADKQVVAEP